MSLPSSSAQQVQATGYGQEAALSNARPSVTKKQREQKQRERRIMKAEKRAARKLAHANPAADHETMPRTEN
jgi:hypothetical protein